jgi:signal transduction histidine kinase
VEAPPAALIDRLTPAAAVVQAMAGSEDTVLSTTQPLTTPLGTWSMILQSSTAAIDARQRALLWQLFLTTAAVVVAMLSVGVFIVRQQRTAATLETELRGARALADLRERSDKILDNVSVGIVGATSAGRMVFANRFLQQQRGFPAMARADGGAAGADALSRWTSSLRPDIERSVANGRTGLVSRASEVGADDTTGPALDVRVVPLEHPVDDVAALILVEDLSELHRLRRDLVRAEKLITVGVLTAGIAHEIGTPLMVIRGQAEPLLEKIGDTPAAPGLEAIMSQIDRIAATISRVLDFSRAQPLQVQPTSLPQAVSRAAQLLEWRLRAKRLSLQVRTPADLPPLAADPLQLEQVLVNLLMNACDASSEDGAIDLSTTSTNDAPAAGAGGEIRIEISDSGSGIRPEDIHAIFDPYFTTKKTGEGTGLGLTIVAQIVHSHHGEIAVASTPGRGTTVSVLWPVAGGAMRS